MKLEEIRTILEADWAGRKPGSADGSGTEVLSCHASDLMSDVLTFQGPGSLLLTGLTNAQVVRTAEMSDFGAICFVRGKKPLPEAVRLAEERQIPLLATPLSMFESCGRLYAKGLSSGQNAKEGTGWRTKK